MLRFEELYPQKFINQIYGSSLFCQLLQYHFVILGLYRAVRHIGQKTILSIIKSLQPVIIIGFLMMMTKEDSFLINFPVILVYSYNCNFRNHYIAYWSFIYFHIHLKIKSVAILVLDKLALCTESIQASDI